MSGSFALYKRVIWIQWSSLTLINWVIAGKWGGRKYFRRWISGRDDYQVSITLRWLIQKIGFSKFLWVHRLDIRKIKKANPSCHYSCVQFGKISISVPMIILHYNWEGRVCANSLDLETYIHTFFFYLQFLQGSKSFTFWNTERFTDSVTNIKKLNFKRAEGEYWGLLFCLNYSVHVLNTTVLLVNGTTLQSKAN